MGVQVLIDFVIEKIQFECQFSKWDFFEIINVDRLL